MSTVYEAIIAWVLLSIALGPFLTWALFYPVRQDRARRKHSMATHPMASRNLIPARVRVSDVRQGGPPRHR
jgi:hypothetical protein